MKKIFVFLLILFSLSLASASHTYTDFSYKESYHKNYYHPRDYTTISNNIYVNYDNEDRLSTKFYRHGYSYRTSTGYWQDNHGGLLDKYDNDYYDYKMGYSFRNPTDSHNYNYDREYYYDLNPYSDSYEIKECYYNPPRGKLFYRKCL